MYSFERIETKKRPKYYIIIISLFNDKLNKYLDFIFVTNKKKYSKKRVTFVFALFV